MNQKIIKICEEKFIYLNYSPRTKDNYMCHIKDFLNTLNDKQIIHCSSKDFQFYLDNYKFTSVSQQNQVINAIRFLYKFGLDKKYDKVSFKRPRNEKKLPKVIDGEFIKEKDSDTHINNEIGDVSYETYTCIKSVDSYLEGVEYYVNIKENKGTPIVTESDNGEPLSKETIYILNNLNISLERTWKYLSEMRDVSISDDPLVWIVTELNSLKYEKMVVDFKFFNHFKKCV